MTRPRIVAGIRVLVVVALVAAIGWQSAVLRSDRRDDRLLDNAVAIAKAQVLDLTTLDSSNVDAKVKAMAARTSGDFKDQATAIAATFAKVVQEKKVKATGRIDGFGVSSSSKSEVSVVIASTAVVSVAGTAEPTTRTYRIRVKLDRAGAGWKINGMEFVQ